MKKKELSKMTNDELLLEKQKMKSSKIFNAVFIGFLGGILAVGVFSLIVSSKKTLRFGFR
jgi:hypothetical protein